jgi:hypothetical protein
MSVAHECDDVYLPLACPKCGNAGQIALSCLNRRFRCKECRTRFYIDNTGNFSLGDPPTQHAAGGDAVGRRRAIVLSWIARIWKLVPRWARWVGLAASIVLLGGIFAVWLLTGRVILPDSLSDRAVFVAESFARNEPAQIELLASPESAADVPDLIRKARPDVWKGSLATNLIINASAEIMAEDRTAGTACVRVAFIIPPTVFSDQARSTGTARKAKDKPGGEFNLILFWVLSDQGTWLLDVERSLKAAPHANSD